MMPHSASTAIGVCAILLLIHVVYSEQATQSGSCPSPCRCLFFEGLWSVYCNRTGIRTIPTNIPRSTQLLDLAGNNIQSLQKTDVAYLSKLQNLDISENYLTDESIEPGALELPYLTTVDVSENKFSRIPNMLPRNLTTLYFLYNNIGTLKADSVVHYPSLTYIDVSNCGLGLIENHTFDSVGELSVLYASFNKLTDDSFPPNILMKNTKLTLLGLRFNQLEQLLQDLPSSLLHLDYVGNNIKTIPKFAFRSLPNLQTIELWNGQITTIEDDAFYGLPNLSILDINTDKVSSAITNNTFNGLIGLQTLYFYENQISRIEPMAFSSFRNITSIWLSSNNLTSLVPEVLDMRFIPHLSELFIDFNPWNCDCHLRWLREKVDNASYVIQDPHLITCASPKAVAGKAWDILKPSDFICA